MFCRRVWLEVEALRLIHLQLQAFLTDQAVHAEVKSVGESLSEFFRDERLLKVLSHFLKQLHYHV